MSNLYDKVTRVDAPNGYTWETSFHNITLSDGEKLYYKWRMIHRGFMWERSVTDIERNDNNLAEEWKRAVCAEIDYGSPEAEK